MHRSIALVPLKHRTVKYCKIVCFAAIFLFLSSVSCCCHGLTISSSCKYFLSLAVGCLCHCIDSLFNMICNKMINAINMFFCNRSEPKRFRYFFNGFCQLQSNVANDRFLCQQIESSGTILSVRFRLFFRFYFCSPFNRIHS